MDECQSPSATKGGKVSGNFSGLGGILDFGDIGRDGFAILNLSEDVRGVSQDGFETPVAGREAL